VKGHFDWSGWRNIRITFEPETSENSLRLCGILAPPEWGALPEGSCPWGTEVKIIMTCKWEEMRQKYWKRETWRKAIQVSRTNTKSRNTSQRSTASNHFNIRGTPGLLTITVSSCYIYGPTFSQRLHFFSSL